MAVTITNVVGNSREKTFDIYNIDVGVLNAIRRAILADVPNFGISFDPYDKSKSNITFYENTSTLHNEFLGHRISLLPVQFDAQDFAEFDGSQYQCVIEKHNTSNEMIDVTTNDIVIYDKNKKAYPTDLREKLFPVCDITKDPILIVKLNPNIYNPEKGEKLHVSFTPSIDKGSTHSRFCPVSTCTYFNIIDEKAAEFAFEEYAEKQANTNRDILRKRFDIHDRYRHFVTNAYGEPSGFTVTIESECRLTPEYLFLRGIEVLQEKLDRVVQENRISVSKLADDTFGFLLKQENHTLGNLIQVMMYNRFKRQENTIDYIGYYLIHPSISEIVVKIRFQEKIHDTKQALKEFTSYIASIQEDLRELRQTVASSFEA